MDVRNIFSVHLSRRKGLVLIELTRSSIEHIWVFTLLHRVNGVYPNQPRMCKRYCSNFVHGYCECPRNVEHATIVSAIVVIELGEVQSINPSNLVSIIQIAVVQLC